MIEEGFILLSRQLIGSKLWSCSDATLKVALYLLLSANHKPLYFKRILIAKGQSCRSLYRIGDDCGVSIKAVRHALKTLVKDDFISIDMPFGAKQGQRITILKYDTYQNPASYKGTRGAHEGTHEGTMNKNERMKEDVYIHAQGWNILTSKEKVDIVENIILAYPRQEGLENGRRAIARVLSKGSVDHNTLYKKVKEYSIAISKHDPTKIPFPERWINEKRWAETWVKPQKDTSHLQGIQPGSKDEYPKSEDF